jgi:alkylation response protein AidB-like acyl-CoA dehydrogenase
MANYFTDNEDIKFHFEHAELAPIVNLQEDGFKEKDLYDYAPQDVRDAIDNYRRVLEIVGEIAAEFIAPRSPEIDKEGNTLADGRVTYAKGMRECIEELAKADLMGFTLPRKFGGLNMPNLMYTMAIEMVSRADASLMNIFGLQGIAETINAYASEELKARYLPHFCAGKITGAMALTEPDAGSDLQNVKLAATEAGDGTWRLNGVKRFITNGCGDVLVVLARSEPDRSGGMGLSLFICERGDHLRVRRLENKLGIHGSPTCELQFNDAPAYLIGERMRGLIYGMSLMNGARIGIAAQALGIAQAAFNQARRYAFTRQQFGRRIEQFPAVADMLVEMRTSLEAARELTYEASRVVDHEIGTVRRLEFGKPSDPAEKDRLNKDQRKYRRLASLLTPMAKYMAAEMSMRVASDAIQVLGGSGYMKDYPVERHFRDARITAIYEGTSQLQVVGAIGGIMSGVAEKYLEELAQEKPAPGLEPLAEKLGQARQCLGKSVEYLKGKKDNEYTDLCARRLVDMTSDVIIGHLFLRHAPHDERKAAMAQRWITQGLARAKMSAELITGDERSTLSKYDAIVGPVKEEN